MKLGLKMKLYSTIATTVGAFLVCATPAQANTGIKSGFYAGASIGLSNLSGSQDFNAANSDPAQPTVANRLRLSGNSVGASIFGGYGYRLNCTWFATELSYLFDRIESKSTTTAANVPGEKVFKGRSTGAFGEPFILDISLMKFVLFMLFLV